MSYELYRDQLIKFTIYSIINQIKIVLGESGRLKRKQTYPAEFFYNNLNQNREQIKFLMQMHDSIHHVDKKHLNENQVISKEQNI